jgi:transcriptional regulator with XRE-family HTH domain
MSKGRYSREEVLEMLKKRQGERTQKELAEELGVSPQYVCDLFQGHRFIGVRILEALGMYREWSYYFRREA